MEEALSKPLDPARLHQLNYGYKRGRAAHVAVKLYLFSELHRHREGAKQAKPCVEDLKLAGPLQPPYALGCGLLALGKRNSW